MGSDHRHDRADPRLGRQRIPGGCGHWSKAGPDPFAGRLATALVTIFEYRVVYLARVKARPMVWRPLIGSLLVLTAAEAAAAPLTVRVADEKGRPVSDAVVILRAGPATRPSTGGSFSVSQRDMQFHPF